jgi:hypothetical protein
VMQAGEARQPAKEQSLTVRLTSSFSTDGFCFDGSSSALLLFSFAIEYLSQVSVPTSMVIVRVLCEAVRIEDDDMRSL